MSNKQFINNFRKPPSENGKCTKIKINTEDKHILYNLLYVLRLDLDEIAATLEMTEEELQNLIDGIE